jgi:hypothetical protein
MMRIDKAPDSVKKNLEKGFKTDPPTWDSIQTASTELVKVSDELVKANAPPKGTKESWEKQTAAFHETAVALDKAAQAKDVTAAKEAHTKFTNSCEECHTLHRPRGGPGGPGGPPMGGFGPPMGGGRPPMGGGGPPMGGGGPPVGGGVPPMGGGAPPMGGKAPMQG